MTKESIKGAYKIKYSGKKDKIIKGIRGIEVSKETKSLIGETFIGILYLC